MSANRNHAAHALWRRANAWLWPRYVHGRVWGGAFIRAQRRNRGGVRILTYHGVCRDGDERLPWIPPYFVTESLLDQHLTWLKSCGEVIPLSEAMWHLQSRKRDHPLSYVITFDDGYYNNLSLAAPVLQAHGATATVFLVTGPIDCGGEVPSWMQVRILEYLQTHDAAFLPGESHGEFLNKARNLAVMLPSESAPRVSALWRSAADRIPASAVDAVRLLRPDEVQCLLKAGFEIGAHTVTHPHLARLENKTRRREIRESVTRVRELAGRHDIAFAYPNGRAIDFGEIDIEVLRSLRVPLALTAVPGLNGYHTNPHRLLRLAVSRRKTRSDFLAMVDHGLYDHDRLIQPP